MAGHGEFADVEALLPECCPEEALSLQHFSSENASLNLDATVEESLYSVRKRTAEAET